MKLPMMSAAGLFQQFQNYLAGEDGSRQVAGVNWSGQTFKPATTHDITRVILKCYRVLLPGDVIVSIRATSAGLPTGSDLASVTIDGDLLPELGGISFKNFDLGGGTRLTSGTTYAMIWRAVSGSAGNEFGVATDDSSPAYADGSRVDSADSGSAWSAITTVDHLFEEWGTP